jgi:hypothetical protein
VKLETPFLKPLERNGSATVQKLNQKWETKGGRAQIDSKCRVKEKTKTSWPQP